MLPSPLSAILWRYALEGLSLPPAAPGSPPYLVVGCNDGQGICADLVGGVAVGDHPVSAHHHRVHLHKCGRRSVGNT